MLRRIGVMSAAIAVMALGTTTVPSAEAAAAGKTWCMTYCDAINIGCRNSIGLWEPETCEHWHAGCLDGCRVND